MTSTSTRNLNTDRLTATLSTEQIENWEVKTVLIWTALGALVGLISGAMLVRSAREHHVDSPHVSTSDAFKLAITAIGLVRSIAGLGDRR